MEPKSATSVWEKLWETGDFSRWWGRRLGANKSEHGSRQVLRAHWSTIFNWSMAPVINGNVVKLNPMQWRRRRAPSEQISRFIFTRSRLQLEQSCRFDWLGQKMGPQFAISSPISIPFDRKNRQQWPWRPLDARSSWKSSLACEELWSVETYT